MALSILAYLAGILTILSPCILPALPFVFSRADQPFSRTGLPLGMAVALMGVATLASVCGGWAVETNQYGRLAALALLALFAMTLLSELPFERDTGNVRKAITRLKIGYPVVIDNDYAIWKVFGKEYWPAAYFVDAEGRIRHHNFGEHDYENSECVIQKLLIEAGNRNVPSGFVTASNAAPLTLSVPSTDPRYCMNGLGMKFIPEGS